MSSSFIESLESRRYLALNMVSDMNGIYPRDTVTLPNGTSYFAANDGSHGTELWTSDGTLRGTVMVRDLTPGYRGTIMSSLVRHKNGVAFMTRDPVADTCALWISDGTKAGTIKVVTISARFESMTIVSTGERVVFIENGVIGQNIPTRLWSCDGTAAGTRVIREISEDFTWIRSSPVQRVGDRVVFGSKSQGVWSTDGTEAGTFKIVDLPVGSWFHLVGKVNEESDYLYWVDDRLYATDGTHAGTQVILQSDQWADGNTPIIVDGRYYFSKKGGNYDQATEIWQSDGTAAGTKLAFNAVGLVMYGVGVNGKVFFTNSIHHLTLPNGEDASYCKVLGFDPATGNVNVVWEATVQFGLHNLSIAGNKLFFFAFASQGHCIAYRSDGTAAGTEAIDEWGWSPYVWQQGSRLGVSNGAVTRFYNTDDSQDELAPSNGYSSLAGGVLRVFGTNGNDNIRVFQNTGDASRIVVQVNGVRRSYALSQISRIKIYGYGGDDAIAFVEKYGKLGTRTNIDGGSGDDILYTGGGRDTIGGGFGDDTIASGNNDDAITAGDGDDSIMGGNGNDSISGGDGADFVQGNKGDDQLGAGDDDASDTLDGNDGADVLFGQSVLDVFFIGSGKNDRDDLILG